MLKTQIESLAGAVAVATARRNDLIDKGDGMMNELRSNFNVRILAVCIAAASAGSPALAQCDVEEWSSLGSGMNEFVLSLGEYNGDLIASGQFTTAGGNPANRIARWDGEAWTPLGAGTSARVRATLEHNGQLIVGGNFATAGGAQVNRIAQWDGSSWAPLGSGVFVTSPPFPFKSPQAVVNALVEHEGDLIAGGTFSKAGDVTAHLVARWNGSNWQPVGQLDITTSQSVLALTVYDGDLIAAGNFSSSGGASLSRIARWDGSNWQPLGSGVNAEVLSVTVFKGELVAAGLFTTAGGVAANRIARWNGSSWQPLGSGMNGTVVALAVHNGYLVAGGTFTTAGGVTVNRIARWDGSAWSAIPAAAIGANQSVEALSIFNGGLIAGGRFTSIGGVGANYIAKWSKPPVLGACCVNGIAIQTFGPDCAAAGGQFHGEGVPSNEVNCPPQCTADLTGSGSVGVPDLLQLLSQWGPCP